MIFFLDHDRTGTTIEFIERGLMLLCSRQTKAQNETLLLCLILILMDSSVHLSNDP